MAITHSWITMLVCYSLFIFDIWNAWVVILWIAYPLNKGKTMQHFSNDVNIQNCQHGTGLLPLIYKSLLTRCWHKRWLLPLIYTSLLTRCQHKRGLSPFIYETLSLLTRTFFIWISDPFKSRRFWETFSNEIYQLCHKTSMEATRT